MDVKPIGVFDSGLGGLTVLKELSERFPHEDFLYLGDTARLPYGSKSTETIQKYVYQNINYLLQKNVKAVVVACNSASTVLRGPRPDFSVPIFEVIGPGAQVALKQTQNRKIGVVATWATITNKAYTRALLELDSDVEVYAQACPLLVPLVEEGWIDDPLTHLVIHRYLGPLLHCGIDTLILGCTHYPALKLGFQKVVGPNIRLTDSGSAVADQLQTAFLNQKIEQNPNSHKSTIRILSTDLTPRYASIAAQLLDRHNEIKIEKMDL